MRNRTPFLVLVLASLLLPAAHLFAKPPKDKGGRGGPPGLEKKGGVPPGLAKKGGVPPGLAKKGGLPPGLAKKYGRRAPAEVYVAFDPRHDDRAWFLVDGAWVERRGFEASIRGEVRASLRLPPPPAPPPVPLPRVGVDLRVVLFQ